MASFLNKYIFHKAPYDRIGAIHYPTSKWRYTRLTDKRPDVTNFNLGSIKPTIIYRKHNMARQQIDDCFLHDKDRLTHEQALSILKSNLRPTARTELIRLCEAANRVLAEDLHAPRPIPAHRNSAVDGYAFAFKDYDPVNGSFLPLKDRITAGDPLITNSEPSTTARIFTGAVMPQNFDSVVMQEDITLTKPENDHGNSGTIVHIPPGLKPNANCRQAGEDTAQNGLLVARQTKLLSRHIAAIASAGINQLSVYTPLKVAVFSTGNEVIRPGETFELGKVFDSNGPMLNALTQAQNCQLTNLGVLKDNPETIESALKAAAQTHDVIITSGGASKGDEDHILTALEKLGKRHLWQLAIKPGRPMSFGQIEDTIFIGLPGNPVASYICFFLYAIPILQRLSGQQWQVQHRYQIPAKFTIKNKKPDRREFLRGILTNENGRTAVEKFGKDGSGLIHSLTVADGLIEIDEATTTVNEGDLVNFIPFAQPTF